MAPNVATLLQRPLSLLLQARRHQRALFLPGASTVVGVQRREAEPNLTRSLVVGIPIEKCPKPCRIAARHCNLISLVAPRPAAGPPWPRRWRRLCVRARLGFTVRPRGAWLRSSARFLFVLRSLASGGFSYLGKAGVLGGLERPLQRGDQHLGVGPESAHASAAPRCDVRRASTCPAIGRRAASALRRPAQGLHACPGATRLQFRCGQSPRGYPGAWRRSRRAHRFSSCRRLK